MPRQRVCRQCGYEGTDVSSNYLCQKCQLKNIHKAAKQMKEQKGPLWEKWKQRTWAAMKRIVGE